ncbi:MAG: DNA primase [Actinomycetes bacterium]
MPRISPDDIASVRERAPIAEIVGEQVTLRNAGGGSLKGLCPFHDEKSPSFHVTPSKGLYFCFGCQAGGDVIDFVRRIDHLDFNEAVEKLAARAGVQLRYEEAGTAPRRQAGERTRLLEAHREAATFYAEQLGAAESVVGRRFLDERGFDAQAAQHFGVGFAPAGWDALTRHLRGRGFTDRELTVGGLAKEGPRGLIDRFRGRLVWPIRDITGDTVGFGARRLLDDDPGPKYLNSAESPIYRKSQVLYGIDLAKRDIANHRQAVIVEGYTDVMACHLSGVTTAVATCGTAFGEEHRKVLRRLLMDADAFAGEVVFTFDGDAAGQKAAMRAFEDDQRFVAQTFVAVERHGLDPCELRQQYGSEAVAALVEQRVPLFEFAIRSLLAGHNLDLPEGRVAALHAAAPLVARIRDVSLRPEYARALAGWLGMDVGPVQAAVNEASRRAPRQQPRPGQHRTGTATTPTGAGSAEVVETPEGVERSPEAVGVQRPEPSERRLLVDRELLKVAVQSPDLLDARFDQLPSSAFAHPAYSAVSVAVADAGGVADAKGGEAWVVSVQQAASNDVVRGLVTELAVEPVRADGPLDERYALEQLARIRVRSIDGAVEQLRSRLQRLDPAADEYAAVFGELVALEQQRRQLNDEAVGER